MAITMATCIDYNGVKTFTANTISVSGIDVAKVVTQCLRVLSIQICLLYLVRLRVQKAHQLSEVVFGPP